MALGLSTCEEHDCVVVYSGKKCPMCELVAENAEYTTYNDDLLLKVEELQSYNNELVDELAQYNLPVIAPSEGRYFRQD